MTKSEADFLKHILLEKPLDNSYGFVDSYGFRYTYPAFLELTLAKIRWKDFIQAMKEGKEDTFIKSLEEKAFLQSERDRAFEEICNTFKGFRRYCKNVSKNTENFCREMIEEYPQYFCSDVRIEYSSTDKETFREANIKALEETKERMKKIAEGDREAIENEIARALEQCPATPGLFSFQVFFNEKNRAKKVAGLPLGWIFFLRTIKENNYCSEGLLAEESFTPPQELLTAFDTLRGKLSSWLSTASEIIASNSDFIGRPWDDREIDSLSQKRLADALDKEREADSRMKRAKGLEEKIAKIKPWVKEGNLEILRMIELGMLSPKDDKLLFTEKFTRESWKNFRSSFSTVESFIDRSYLYSTEGKKMTRENFYKWIYYHEE